MKFYSTVLKKTFLKNDIDPIFFFFFFHPQIKRVDFRN